MGNKQEIIEIIKTNTVGNWTPILGSETTKLLEHIEVDEASKDQLLREASRILSRCVPPRNTDGSETGLVLGYVQSGKTMSFTTVTTLARDNGYRLIVVIAGISTILTEQSTRRLYSDLRLESRRDRKWLFFNNPRSEDSYRPIRDALLDWNDDNVSQDMCQTVLITVMKNHKHLEHLATLFERIELTNVPCLIIDDEGDQASLNTLVNSGQESTTYRRILQLRRTMPHRSYLQYTATPQAPLLINIIDLLSPSFAEILEPGNDYVGGEDFFIRQTDLTSIIPQRDTFNHHNPPNEPPDSLLEALRIFFIGVAAGMIVDREAGNRTMLIHPSYRTIPHTLFTNWVRRVKDLWVDILGSDDAIDKKELFEDFQQAYNELSLTAKNIPLFDEIIKHLQRSIRRTNILEINATSGKTPTVEWNNVYAHILIGGQAMDRGFTVEGLTVTYMPRGVGMGNADTIQQRARFFGYKRRYLGYCRIFVDSQTNTAYTQYVNHEKSIRDELRDFQQDGKTLYEWRRQFLMPARLRPTRSNVIDVNYFQDIYSDRWFNPRTPHYEESTIDFNRGIANRFLEQLNLTPDIGHPGRTETQRHLVDESVPLQVVHEKLLVLLQFSQPTDANQFVGILLQLRDYLASHNEARCTVYKMSSNQDEWITRERSLNSNQEISQLMQGAHPNSRGEIYPGDRNIGDKNHVVVQLHKLNLTEDKNRVAEDVINIAIWIPNKLAQGWLIQDQNEESN